MQLHTHTHTHSQTHIHTHTHTHKRTYTLTHVLTHTCMRFEKYFSFSFLNNLKSQNQTLFQFLNLSSDGQSSTNLLTITFY